MTTSLSAGVAALASGLRFAGARPRSSSPTGSSRRSARSGTRRSRAARASSTCTPSDGRSRSALHAARSTTRRSSSRSRTSATATARGSTSRRSSAGPRARRAGAARRLPGDRLAADRRDAHSASTSSPRACSSTCSAPPGSRSSTAGASSCRARGRPPRAGSPTQRLRDGHPRLLACADARRFQSGTPPVPSIYAGIAGIELMQEIGIAETREHVRAPQRAADRGSRRARRHVATPRNPSERGALVCIPRRDAARTGRGARQGGHRHLLARRQPARLAHATTLPRT